MVGAGEFGRFLGAFGFDHRDIVGVGIEAAEDFEAPDREGQGRHGVSSLPPSLTAPRRVRLHALEPEFCLISGSGSKG